MPWFTYKCRKCGEIFRDLQSISNRDTPVECKCGSKADRDVEAELATRAGCKWVTENERWSRSMGVPVKQLAWFRKKYPHHVYNDKGHLLIKNRKHKLKQAKEREFVELNDNTSKAWFR